MAVLTSLGFPILRLPFLAWRLVLDRMDTVEILRYSFCSKKTMSSIISSKRRIPEFTIYFDRTIVIQTGVVGRILIQLNPKSRVSIYTMPLYPECVNVEINNCYQDISREGFTVRDYINHFMRILKCSSINLIFPKNFNLYGFDWIREAFDGLKINRIAVHDELEEDWAQSLFQEYFPTVKNFSFTYKDRFILDLILSYPFERLRFLEEFPISLEELLRIQSTRIDITKSTLTIGDLHVFILAWINNELNPDLKSVYIKFPREFFNEEKPKIIFTGIDYEVKETIYDEEKKLLMDGGIDIEREDGRRAKILFEELPKSVQFQFLVVC